MPDKVKLRDRFRLPFKSDYLPMLYHVIKINKYYSVFTDDIGEYN